MQTSYCASRMLEIRHSIGRASDVDYSTFDGRPFECRKYDIRRTALRMSNIRHSTEANIGSKIESNLFAHLYSQYVESATGRHQNPQINFGLELVMIPRVTFRYTFQNMWCGFWGFELWALFNIGTVHRFHFSTHNNVALSWIPM